MAQVRTFAFSQMFETQGNGEAWTWFLPILTQLRPGCAGAGQVASAADLFMDKTMSMDMSVQVDATMGPSAGLRYTDVLNAGLHPAWGAAADLSDAYSEPTGAPGGAGQEQLQKWGFVPGEDDTA